ncbi:hypothetical protein LCGC14_1470570 [marine sediment metagenome]|uniref:DUF7831 domain-containing protein n=1 Tax=marine sediment metagenome TaxID=412755 RepID=A0A0F9LSY9_9ZZZZ
MTLNEPKFITREFIKLNPHVLFVFGDNDERWGYGGMAKEFRGEPNAIGIRTKKAPRTDDDSFYTDDEFELNVRKIDIDIAAIACYMGMERYTVLYIPEGIGKGLAKLEEKAPETYRYLEERLNQLRGQFI